MPTAAGSWRGSRRAGAIRGARHTGGRGGGGGRGGPVLGGEEVRRDREENVQVGRVDQGFPVLKQRRPVLRRTVGLAPDARTAVSTRRGAKGHVAVAAATADGEHGGGGGRGVEVGGGGGFCAPST